MGSCFDCIKKSYCEQPYKGKFTICSYYAPLEDPNKIEPNGNSYTRETPNYVYLGTMPQTEPLYHDLVLPTAYRCNTKKEAIQFIETISFRNKNQHVTITRRDNKWVVSYFDWRN